MTLLKYSFGVGYFITLDVPTDSFYFDFNDFGLLDVLMFFSLSVNLMDGILMPILGDAAHEPFALDLFVCSDSLFLRWPISFFIDCGLLMIC